MRLVVIESPFAGAVDRNVAYAREAIGDALKRGEAPFASHLLYTQPGILDDTKPEERARGIEAGLAIAKRLDATVLYVDLGISGGMVQGIEHAAVYDRPVEMRSIRGGIMKVDVARLELLVGDVSLFAVRWACGVESDRVRIDQARSRLLAWRPTPTSPITLDRRDDHDPSDPEGACSVFGVMCGEHKLRREFAVTKAELQASRVPLWPLVRERITRELRAAGCSHEIPIEEPSCKLRERAATSDLEARMPT